MMTLVLAATLLSGCAMFRSSLKETQPGTTAPLQAGYDQNDLLKLAQQMSAEVLAQPFPPAGENQPIMVVLGIQNRTETHIDTMALADTITTKLMDSGKLRFVNSARRDELLKEQGYQLANATPETRTKIGRQLGAKYMLTGSITEISRESMRQARVSKKQDVYYQLTCEVTDLETGLIAVRKQIDRQRTAQKPIIGW
jgi:penicillin-binding protein activator